ncbi:hypothetical protein G6F46_009351 [Rhizopus delemar]|uniref:CCHC-type domain-containing protein n=2 Tax=Rhizopus TaxID=4842 RepID=A0A9P6YX61_9FUNG|nr:hypothetical protein G6F55_008531 [Rhizopus delemar]KAG1538845.1 hypothetical protein G6F51_009513 [Rhizopus arrhizus]KAG1528125.1 hypothetical protein G6F52_000927 [Rhizopus delemar]KAG1547562.1 hypothetical protein G6F49_010166 [Rhizopus delemar]KAG1566354.1 hypothetical protein G6F50_009223 [Rhizopus delemar]
MPTYCKYCHELGHSAVQCKEAPSNKRTCFYCFKPGHIRAQCPDKFVLGKHRKANPSSSTLPGVTPPIAEPNTDITISTTMASSSLSVEVSSNVLNVNDDDECSDPFSAPIGLLKDPSADLIHTTDQRSFESSNRSIYASPVKETEDSGSSTSGENMILTDLTQLTELLAELDITHELMDTCSDEDAPNPSLIIKDTRSFSAPIDRQILPGTLLRKSTKERKPAYILLSLNVISPYGHDTVVSSVLIPKVSHINGQIALFHILVVYAPISSPHDRQEFFDTLLTFQQLSPYDPGSCVDRMIIAGDFNYTLKSQALSSRSSVPSRGLHFLQYHFKNVMMDLGSLDTPTFRLDSSTQSIIDYIYVSLDLSINFVETDVEFINSTWTDHALLQMTLKTDFQFNTGPGIWRANPIYADIKEYCQQLANMLTALYNQEIENSSLTPQDLWDLVKCRVQIFTRQFGRKRVDWRKQQIAALQKKKRQRLLRGPLPTSLLAIHLPRVEQQIQTLQQEDQMLEITEQFYMDLYSVDPICPSAFDDMASHIPRPCCLSTEDSKLISSPFVKNDILEQVKRTPKLLGTFNENDKTTIRQKLTKGGSIEQRITNHIIELLCQDHLTPIEQETLNQNFDIPIDDNASEMTYYRRFAVLPDYVFGGSDINMTDGEVVAEATRMAMRQNDYDTSNLFGRKIDLLKIKDTTAELTSNEWKSNRTKHLQLKQQSKNLRSNCAILNKLYIESGTIINKLH